MKLRTKSSAIIPSGVMATYTALLLLGAIGCLVVGLVLAETTLLVAAAVLGGWGLLYVFGTALALDIERDDR